MTDTAPGTIDPETIDGAEPPVTGETPKERRARKARNRRKAEKLQREANPEPAPPGPSRGRPSAASKRAQSVTGIVTGVGIAVMMVDEHDGTAIIEGAPALGDSLAKVADKSPKVARALDALTETSAWAEVALAVGAIVLPIVKHHGIGLDMLRAPDPAPAPAPARPAAPVVKPGEHVSPDAPVFTVNNDPAPPTVPTFSVNG